MQCVKCNTVNNAECAVKKSVRFVYSELCAVYSAFFEVYSALCGV